MNRNAAKSWRGRIRLLAKAGPYAPPVLVADTHPGQPDAAPLDDSVQARGLKALVALVGACAAQYHGEEADTLRPAALAKRLATIRTYLAKPGAGGRALVRLKYTLADGSHYVAYLDVQHPDASGATGKAAGGQTTPPPLPT